MCSAELSGFHWINLHHANVQFSRYPNHNEEKFRRFHWMKTEPFSQIHWTTTESFGRFHWTKTESFGRFHWTKTESFQWTETESFDRHNDYSLTNQEQTDLHLQIGALLAASAREQFQSHIATGHTGCATRIILPLPLLRSLLFALPTC